MSTVNLHIELPSYSHSFPLSVPVACTILSLKQRIQSACTGAPKVEGQKLIWRGRFLRDEEVLGDIWKPDEDGRTVLLAVHPTAWTLPPPELPSLPQSSSSVPLTGPSSVPMSLGLPPASPATPPISAIPSPIPTPTMRFHPLQFVISLHQDALNALVDNIVPSVPNILQRCHQKLVAKQIVQKNGFAWPAALDEEWPDGDETEPKVKYERFDLGGKPFLVLRSSSTNITARQTHALKILSYTFSILSLPLPPPPPPAAPSTVHLPYPADVNQLLQQLGVRLALAPHPRPQDAQEPRQPPPNHNRIVNAVGGLLPDLRQLRLRPLIGPFVTLIVRTMLMVYFVSPARTPVFALLMCGWLIYEIGWGHLRMAFIDVWRQQREAEGGAPGRHPHAPRQAGQAQARGAHGQQRAQLQSLMNAVANTNLAWEAEVLAARPGVPVPEEPSVGQKAMAFVSLLLMTVHPAVWNARRATLRAREGALRMEAAARERELEGEDDATVTQRQVRAGVIAMHERRPGWVREYVDRVRHVDRVDE